MPSMVSRGRGRRTINEINMVPFIDVMLVLLIIFMVTAPLIAPSVIDLPSVGKAAKQPDQVIQLILAKNDTIQMKIKDKSSSIALKEVATAVKAAQGSVENSAVVISSARHIKHHSLVKRMHTLHRAVVHRVRLSVQLAN